MDEQTNNQKNLTNIGKLIDGSIDELREHLSGKNIGYAHSLILLLEDAWVQLISIKDLYLDRLKGDSLSKEEQMELKRCVVQVNQELIKVGQKVEYLTNYEKEKSLDLG